MIKVAGIKIENCPKNKNKDDLLLGELNSAAYHFLKTPVEIYGENIQELVELAKNIKKIDSSFDTLLIYNLNREHIKTKKI